MRFAALIIASLVVQCAQAAGAEPVNALLYGPSEGFRYRLDQLPKGVSFLKVSYTVPGSKRSRQLLVGVSGGIESSEVLSALYAARLHDWTFGRTQLWRLFVHGDASHARITVKDHDTCFPPTSWFLFREGALWVLFDGPGTPTYVPPEPCEFIVPPPVEYAGRASNKSLERTREE
jgi:hypothetical protein